MAKIIGVGPGNPKYLTDYGRQLIQSSKYVIAFERIAHDLKELNPNIISVNKVDQAVDLLRDKPQGILLASGDALFFGIGQLIVSKGIEIDEIIPGITSVQFLFSQIHLSYSNVITKSIHGRDIDFSLLENDQVYAFLIDDLRGPNYISQRLKDLGKKGKIIVGYNLSYEDQEIIEFEIGQTIEEISSLGVVVVKFEDN